MSARQPAATPAKSPQAPSGKRSRNTTPPSHSATLSPPAAPQIRGTEPHHPQIPSPRPHEPAEPPATPDGAPRRKPALPCSASAGNPSHSSHPVPPADLHSTPPGETAPMLECACLAGARDSGRPSERKNPVALLNVSGFQTSTLPAIPRSAANAAPHNTSGCHHSFFPLASVSNKCS